MPARCAPPPGFNAVSRAPHNLPFAYITCCMRVSLASGRDTTSVGDGAGGLKMSRQQPMPAIVGVVESLMQKPCGAPTVGAEPLPGCFCFGGSAYVFTPTSLFDSE